MPFPHLIFPMDARGDITDALGSGFSDGDPDGTAWPLADTSRVWANGPPRTRMLMTLRDKPRPVGPDSAVHDNCTIAPVEARSDAAQIWRYALTTRRFHKQSEKPLVPIEIVEPENGYCVLT